MSSPEAGGEGQQRAIEYVLLRRAHSGLPESNVPEKKRFVFPTTIRSPTEPQVRSVSLGEKPDGAASTYPEAATDNVVAASLDETVDAVVAWSIEKAVELLADVAHPGLGRVISVALKMKEVLDDIEALTSPDSSRDLHVPLLDVPGGIELDLNVHLPGWGAVGGNTPLVSGFVAPGADGLFGGWQIEIDRRSKTAEKERPRSGQDAWTVTEESMVRRKARQAAWSRRYGLRSPAELTYDLAASVPTDDPVRRAVVMREAASMLQGRLHARPEFADRPIIVIYDRAAGMGMWLVKPEPPEALAGRRIKIRLNLGTGMTTVFVR